MLNITSFHVAGLLGEFKHDISFQSASPVAILYGPNGIGKTKILNIMRYLLHLQFEKLMEIPFERAEVVFDSGESLVILRNPELEEDEHGADLPLTGGRSRLDFEVSLVRNFRAIETWNPRAELQEFIQRQWSELRGVKFGEKDSRAVQRMLEREYTSARHRKDMFGPPAWLKGFAKRVGIHMIETQRLVVEGRPDSSERAKVTSVVEEFSDDLVQRIRDALAENGRKSAALDRTFPERVLAHTPWLGNDLEAPSNEEIRKRFERQRTKRAALAEVGLADEGEELPWRDRQLESTERKILWTYLDDIDSKMRTFDQLLDKIQKLLTIINGKFLYKELTIDRNVGFRFTAATGRSIPTSGLSSGEQHELVLAYSLLFKTDPGTVVLIDEPEISLHVAWQQQFVSDLLSIERAVPMQFIVATHSPQIIGKHWQSAIELDGGVHPTGRR